MRSRRNQFKPPWRPGAWLATGAMLIVAVSGCTSSKPTSTSASHTTSTEQTTTTVDPDEASDPLAAGVTPPTTATPIPAGASCRVGDPLANVYHPSRLKVVQACITVTGVVAKVTHEDDGDFHVNVDLDPPFAELINDRNTSGERGALVVEIVPADEPGCTVGQPPRPTTGTYVYGICTGADETPPTVGEHVSVTGPYVLDTAHGWMEVHPAWSIGNADTVPVDTSRPPTSGAPATTTGPSGRASCSAGVSNATPSQHSTEHILVSSDLPSSSVTATAHYKTTNTTHTGTTDGSGDADLPFNIGGATIGFTVVVDVNVGGQVSCETSFTPQ